MSASKRPTRRPSTEQRASSRSQELPAIRRASTTGFQASDVTAHLGTPSAKGGVSTPSKATARKIAKDLATRCCRSGDSRELAQAVLLLIRSIDDDI